MDFKKETAKIAFILISMFFLDRENFFNLLEMKEWQFNGSSTLIDMALPMKATYVLIQNHPMGL